MDDMQPQPQPQSNSTVKIIFITITTLLGLFMITFLLLPIIQANVFPAIENSLTSGNIDNGSLVPALAGIQALKTGFHLVYKGLIFGVLIAAALYLYLNKERQEMRVY